MIQPAYTSKVRGYASLLGALIVAWCLGIGPAVAQDTVPQRSEVVDPSKAETKDEAKQMSAAEELKTEFGLDVAAMPDGGLVARLAETLEDVRVAKEAQEPTEVAAVTAKTSFDVLVEQLAELDEQTRAALMRPAAAKAVSLARAQANRATAEVRLSRATRVAELLQSIASESDAVAVITAAKTRREADSAEAEAVEALARAKQREERERDATLKELLVRERRLAEELLEMTRDHFDAIETIELESKDATTAFANAKAQILADIDLLPPEPPESLRRSKADPALTKLMELRREGRDLLQTARRNLSRTEALLADRDTKVDSARAAISAEQGRSAQLESAVGEHRVAVANAQLNVAEHGYDSVLQQNALYEAQVVEYGARLKLLDTTIESLLPLISDSRHSAFFSIASDANWLDAVEGAREGVLRVVNKVLLRWDQLVGFDWMSITAGAWLWGLFWRLLLALALIRFVPNYVPEQVQRLTAAAFRRRMFRARPRLTIKFAEVVNCLSRPVLSYIAVRYVLAAHIVFMFGELEASTWLIDGFFAYWFVVELASVLVLPRWYRKEQGKSSADALEVNEAEAGAMADILSMEISSAQKLVRSARVVASFSLLAHYVPALVEELFGISVISWVVDFGAGVGLFVVIFWVISTWRDAIAALFERLAAARLPKAVTIVNEHKRRWYGVLIIALASVYVIVVETVMVVRRHVLNTEAFRRASTFAFRKKIELQAQKREEEDDDEVDFESLPLDYRQLFDTGAVDIASPLYFDRPEPNESIVREFSRWRDRNRQGSVALIGESGAGKTTSLLHLVPKLEAQGCNVLFRAVHEKRHARVDVLTFMADLFDLAEIPETKVELIERVRECEPRVLVLDDCHHFFLRRIGGFAGLEYLLDVVNLTDETHFWVLSFNVYAWSYVNRVSGRAHYFGRVIQLPDWSEDEIQALVEHRNGLSSYVMSFTDLVVAHDDADGSDYFYEVVKTARGYFRYLHEFSRGNPRVAMIYWLRSIRPVDGIVQVSLFRRPMTETFEAVSDDHRFVLASLAQHGELNAAEVAGIINIDVGFCHLALNFFEEIGVVLIHEETRRAKLAPLFFRHVIKTLMNSNYLYQ